MLLGDELGESSSKAGLHKLHKLELPQLMTAHTLEARLGIGHSNNSIFYNNQHQFMLRLREPH